MLTVTGTVIARGGGGGGRDVVHNATTTGLDQTHRQPLVVFQYIMPHNTDQSNSCNDYVQ